MKRMLLVLMLVVFGVCARAAWAADAGEGERQRNATGDVIAAIKSTDSTAFRARGDGTAIYVADPYAPAWGQVYYANAINDTFTVGASASSPSNSAVSPFCFDSTAVMPFNTAGFTKLVLSLRSIPPADSAASDSSHTTTYWGIQIRVHPNAYADSANTQVWWAWCATTQTGAIADSISQVGYLYGWSPGVLFPGEKLFHADDDLGLYWSGTVAPQTRTPMTGPPALSVAVPGITGANISVRVHCISRTGTNLTATRKPRFILGVWMGS